MKKTLAIVGLALALSGFVSAAAQTLPPPSIHFSPGENLEKIDVELLGLARKSIDIAAYVLTDVPVIEALANAAQRGVAVRLYRDAGGRDPGARVRDALAAMDTAGIVSRRKKPGPFMHLKGYVVDGEFLRTGAANFSASGLKRQDNDLIVIRDPVQIKAFQTAFETMWSR